MEDRHTLHEKILDKVVDLPEELQGKIMQEVWRKQEFVDIRVSHAVKKMLNFLKFIRNQYKLWVPYQDPTVNLVQEKCMESQDNSRKIYYQIFVKPLMENIIPQMNALIWVKRHNLSNELTDDIFAKICCIVEKMLFDATEYGWPSMNFQNDNFKINPNELRQIWKMFYKVEEEKDIVYTRLFGPFGEDNIYNLYDIESCRDHVDYWLWSWIRHERENHDEDRPHRKLMDIPLRTYIDENFYENNFIDTEFDDSIFHQ